jgi:hypothetical protein
VSAENSVEPPPVVVASWNAPPWAEASERDEDAVIHTRKISTLQDHEGSDLTINLIQRDETQAIPTEIVRASAYVIIGESVCLSLEQASAVGHALTGLQDLVGTVD